MMGDRLTQMLVRLLIAAYPAGWRMRHGHEAGELSDRLLDEGDRRLRILGGFALGAARSWARHGVSALARRRVVAAPLALTGVLALVGALVLTSNATAPRGPSAFTEPATAVQIRTPAPTRARRHQDATLNGTQQHGTVDVALSANSHSPVVVEVQAISLGLRGTGRGVPTQGQMVALVFSPGSPAIGRFPSGTHRRVVEIIDVGAPASHPVRSR
jgi:hypothetical protein